MGILKEAFGDFILLMIDELQTFLVTNKVVAFRLSEGEQGTSEEEGEEEDGVLHGSLRKWAGTASARSFKTDSRSSTRRSADSAAIFASPAASSCRSRRSS